MSLLDSAIGGVAPSFPLVIGGPAGTGRTVLCLQLAHAALERGEGVVYLTGEPGRLLLHQADSLHLDLRGHLEERRLRLLELDADVATTTRAHGGEALMDAIRGVTTEASLLVVDPLTALTGEIRDEVGLRTLVRAVFEAAEDARQLAVVTADDEVLDASPLLDRVLKEACGALLELSVDDEGTRVLQVAKSRTASGVRGKLAFTIGQGGAIPLEDAAPHASGRPEPATQTEPAADAAPEASDDERRKVLVIEDDEAMRGLVREWLSPTYEVLTAADGFQGVSEVLARRPDVIVLDLALPRANGFEVMRTLRMAGQTQPILVLSGQLARSADRVRALVLGATDLMHKPVQSFELLQKIDTLLQLPRPEPVPADEVADAETLLGGDAPLVLEEESFRDRVERACRFGAQFNLPSVLIAVETPSSDALDTFVGAAQSMLRGEDAIRVIGKKRAVCLLVSTSTEVIPKVLGRFVTRDDVGIESPQGHRWRAVEATPASAASPWEPLFEDTEPWPLGSGRRAEEARA